ncbi:ubiquitin carboxyl-terminal hydrolase 51-like [Hydractinia symbiolongicarpus]|uniref:ubiquitin carboxyl-terminal hydrolase 51-like n=1 Tax=Hydractinia symbiolongicarpus TaxID=13093 RepID=UPI00254E2B07|nr:ubiquitin carboxyl-terminal hydrolase 51-like [Hydractinia symbiolongicarpus]
MTIVPLATSSSVANSFHLFFQPEELTDNDMWLCPQYSSLQNSTRETAFSQCGDLILQLKRFTFVEGRSVKNNQFVNCISHSGNILEAPSHPADIVSFTNKYKLVATINHSGTLAAGHYWAFIKDRNVDEWLKCDDRAVVKGKPSDINNSTVFAKGFEISFSGLRGFTPTHFTPVTSGWS